VCRRVDLLENRKKVAEQWQAVLSGKKTDLDDNQLTGGTKGTRGTGGSGAFATVSKIVPDRSSGDPLVGTIAVRMMLFGLSLCNNSLIPGACRLALSALMTGSCLVGCLP
jgi:hypothetical protein